jgi:hypothetical protein
VELEKENGARLSLSLHLKTSNVCYQAFARYGFPLGGFWCDS